MLTRQREHRRPDQTFCDGSAVERVCWDPKDGELCLNRVKPEETLVEARSDSECKSIVKFGYRGERLIEHLSSWFLPKFPQDSRNSVRFMW